MATADLPPIAGTSTPYETPKPVSRKLPEDLNTYSVSELLALRNKIDRLLPAKSLLSINMEQELVLQLAVVKKLQEDTLNDGDVPANQQAQVVNSVASTLSTLAKLQVELFDSERLKTIEQILIGTLGLMSPDAQVEFLTEYERRLGKIDA